MARPRKYKYSSEKYKAYRLRHPEKFTAEYRRARRKPCDIEYRKTQEYKDSQKRYRSGDVYRNAQLVAKYGITLIEFNKLLEKQNGVCGLCFQPLNITDTRDTALDHDHATEAVRGILHRACNIGLGWFKDNPSVMRLAAEYIERYQESLKDAK